MTEKQPDQRTEPINNTAADWENDALPAQEDSTEDLILPNERPQAMDEFGTTGTEKEAGEPLDVALSREEPDFGETRPDPEGDIDADPAAERLVAEDEGVREDDEDELVAGDAGFDRGAYSAEEQAVREREDPDLP
ncbi:DUF5709 domain-containing protein [Marinactinospora thermotolerans]|uniref:DUF5709 domain-containing protein n=1 Tax=Marinactinospora thermotolerans DSM 45154 TaxID=1122192 RepID=A0A1T4SLX2_9ACTN|nr:DUF5709 domain-containing protein [Marinactinospora thermotolerans]SKA29290.1 hypothetical protein SAMN02745673_03692 [Marinactinospora thermotolerans DSM 45154]